jgi:hypothetical protein
MADISLVVKGRRPVTRTMKREWFLKCRSLSLLLSGGLGIDPSGA